MGFAKYAEDIYEIYADRCYMRGLCTEPVIIKVSFSSNRTANIIKQTGVVSIWDSLKNDKKKD